MQKFNKSTFMAMILSAIALSSCSAIAGIFKAGLWVGVIGIIIIIIIIVWIIRKVSKK